jgi:hypothetical protein
MKPNLLVLSIMCLAAQATAFAATFVPIVEIKGAFVKVTINADTLVVGPELIYIRQATIVSIEIWNERAKKEKAKGDFPVYVTVNTSAISTDETDGTKGLSKSYKYRFHDEVSASKFCEALVAHSKG